MKKIAITSLAVLLLTACQPSKKDQLAQAAEKTNQSCPTMIGDDVRMDSVRYFAQKNEFCYFYSLIGQHMHPDSIAATQFYLEQELPVQLSNLVEMKPYKEAGVTMVYTYFSDETKGELFRIAVPAEKY